MKSLAYPISLMIAGLLLFHYEADAQVRAAFSANALAGCSPLAVQFQDMSSGNPVSWKWDLGNGTVSSFQNPSTIYYIPGTYTVKLVVSNGQGSDSMIRQQYITVYGSPSPDFTASDSNGCFPLTVRFTNLTSVSAASVITWQWDFGDGDTASVRDPAHTYRNAGNYTVTLQGTTDKGCHQAFSRDRYIRIGSGIKSSFTDTAAGNCQAPVQVKFAGNSNGPGILSYQWDFGDGSSSGLAAPSHTYAVNGTYTVT
ncbi:MAG TPA: PKD domain-containing protein, partial [Cyclobacteriaceae bacterium]|nr:PKD domain-containing protein [Cyclobacteriaceae bacterium]